MITILGVKSIPVFCCIIKPMIENTRESFLSHEDPAYIQSRPKWVIGRVPDLSDYRKLSVDTMREAFQLARLGQQVASSVIEEYKGGPLTLTFTQALIIGAAILSREQAERYGLDFEKYRSVLMVTPSRYGKSFLNAIVAIIKAALEGKEVRIGGANKDKAGIIQEKIVELLPHTAKVVQDGLIVTDNEGDVNKKVQRMATQVSKEALAWKNGGSIKLFSTNEKEKNAQVGAAGAIGIGGDFVILDEIQLMTPVGFRTSSRFMMESPDTKRFCVGNPQINGHFKELYDDPKTFVIHINEITAIVEERMSRRGIELTDIPTYSNEYRAFIEVEFPDENSGTRFFPTMPQKWDPGKRVEPIVTRRFMGIDSAYKGADGLVVTIMDLNQDADGNRWVVVDKQVDLKKKYQEWTNDTTLNIALDILKMWQTEGVTAGCIDIGLGVHIYEKLLQLYPDMPLEPVAFQQRATEWRVEAKHYNALYAANARSEMHLDLRDLCEGENIYLGNSCYEDIVNQMREVSAVTETSSKIRIEPKKDIKQRIGRSPDSLDSLCLAIRAMVLSGVLDNFGDTAMEDESDLMEVF